MDDSGRSIDKLVSAMRLAARDFDSSRFFPAVSRGKETVRISGGMKHIVVGTLLRKLDGSTVVSGAHLHPGFDFSNLEPEEAAAFKVFFQADEREGLSFFPAHWNEYDVERVVRRMIGGTALPKAPTTEVKINDATFAPGVITEVVLGWDKGGWFLKTAYPITLGTTQSDKA